MKGSIKGKDLRKRIYKHIERRWPVHTRDIAIALGLEPDNGNIKKISYHLRKLEKEEKIITKRIGKALVAWPQEIERLRVINELLRS